MPEHPDACTCVPCLIDAAVLMAAHLDRLDRSHSSSPPAAVAAAIRRWLKYAEESWESRTQEANR